MRKYKYVCFTTKHGFYFIPELAADHIKDDVSDRTLMQWASFAISRSGQLLKSRYTPTPVPPTPVLAQ